MKIKFCILHSLAVFLITTSSQVWAEKRSLVQDEEYVSSHVGTECISATPENGKVVVKNLCMSILQVEYCLERPRVDLNSPTADKMLAAIAAGNTLYPLCQVGSAGVIVTEQVKKSIRYSDGVPSTDTIDAMTAPDATIFAARESVTTNFDAKLAAYMHFIACPRGTWMKLKSINNGVCIDHETRDRLQKDREKLADEMNKPKNTEAEDLFSSAAGKSPEQLQSESTSLQTVHSSGGRGGMLDALGMVAGMGVLKNSADLGQAVTAAKALGGDSNAASDLLMGAVRNDIAKNQARQAQPQSNLSGCYSTIHVNGKEVCARTNDAVLGH